MLDTDMIVQTLKGDVCTQRITGAPYGAAPARQRQSFRDIHSFPIPSKPVLPNLSVLLRF
jgi:hypothetical protein